MDADPVGVDEVFRMYEMAGFLYSAKRARIRPYQEEIRTTWERALNAEDPLLRLVRFGNLASGRFASVSGWRHGSDGWMAQHLVANGCPEGTAATMLAMQEWYLAQPWGGTAQNWFRDANRLPGRIFPEAVTTDGTHGLSAIRDLYELPELLAVRLTTCGLRVDAVEDVEPNVVERYLRDAVEPLWFELEHIGRADHASVSSWRCTRVDWQAVGLDFRRRVLACRDVADGEVVGLAICYDGPVGLNFSFLENRIDITAHRRLPDGEAARVVVALARAAADLKPSARHAISPAVAQPRVQDRLRLAGLAPYRSYRRTAWFGDTGMRSWFEHVKTTYGRILRRKGIGPDA